MNAESRPVSFLPGGTDGYHARKAELVPRLRGTVLEIGAGRGANFGLLHDSVDWIGLEPRARSRAALTATAAGYGRRPRVLAAGVEDIPLPDDSVDAVLSTVVLCSVVDVPAGLAEIRRVLRPDGSFVFFEHVAAPPGTWSRRLQRWVAPVSRLIDGCDPSRDLGAAIESAGFRRLDMRRYRRGATGLYTDHIAGRARC